MSDERVSAWDGDDFGALLALDQLGPNRLRSRSGEANDHDRVYGGQLLAQTVMAAARTVAPDRAPTALQFLFLQGARPERPIDYEVTTLQEGKRFSARHVRGAQAGGRLVCDAQLSFGVALDGPAHMAAPDVAAFAAEDPETLPRLTDLPPALGAEIHRVMSYAFAQSRAVDLRAPDGAAGMRPRTPEPRLRFWIKTRRALPDDPLLHAAAFAYLSDWWLNFPAAGAHVRATAEAGRRLYVASLNHAIWWHRPLRADEWLHFDSVSPSAAAGRGLTIGRIHDRAGRLVASATQECLMVTRDE